MWVSRSIAESGAIPQSLSESTSLPTAAQALSDSATRSAAHGSATALISTTTIYPGQIRNHVKADADSYRRLLRRQRSTPSFLRKIVYCQSGLSNDLTRGILGSFDGSSSSSRPSGSSSASSRGSSAGTPTLNPKSIINHEFLVIVMLVGGRERYFLAEKCGSAEARGISIREVADLGDFRDAEVSSFDCEDTAMDVERVMGILEDHDPDYSAHEKNCWEYAVHSTKKLLFACEDVTGKAHFGDQAKLVGGKVTVNHLKDMAIRGLRAFADMMIK